MNIVVDVATRALPKCKLDPVGICDFGRFNLGIHANGMYGVKI